MAKPLFHRLTPEADNVTLFRSFFNHSLVSLKPTMDVSSVHLFKIFQKLDYYCIKL